MNKFIKNVIYGIGIILLVIVFCVNIIFQAQIEPNEVVNIHINKLFDLVLTIIIAILIYTIGKNIKLNKKCKYILFSLFIVIYLALQILWINYKSSTPTADQATVYNVAIGIKNGNLKEVLENGITYGILPNTVYMQCYQQQFTISFIWSILFRLFSTENYRLIEFLNAICNCITIIALILITGQLSKKYKVNKKITLILIGTFITLPALSTFVYGDESSLAFALIGVYFIMRYTSERKKAYAVMSAISIAIAYMLRMNVLIFILAILIYLVLDLLEEKLNFRKIIEKISMIIIFVMVCFVPSTLTKNYFVNKYNLDKKASFPVTGYLYIGMSESDLECGWYKIENAMPAYENAKGANEEYKELISKRTNYMITHPKYMIQFYLRKVISMWAENSYSAMFYGAAITNSNWNYIKIDGNVTKYRDVIYLYQKALILLIFGSSIIILSQKSKNISKEVLLLLTIFIGGFLFHILWEAKSRYIIPYIVVLIPIASIVIEKRKKQ